MATHTALVLYGARDLRIEERETIPPKANEVQIAIKATGICGSDLHYYAHASNGPFVAKKPLTLGHESAGVVTAIGSATTNFKIGQRVAIEPQNPCRVCSICTGGAYNLCPDMKFMGSAASSPYTHGSLQRLYNHAEDYVYALPDNVSFEEGAMIEPLSVAIHAARRAGLKAGDSVLCFGAGVIGQLCAAVARVAGASQIAVVDIDDDRLSVASKAGLGRGVQAATYRIPKAPEEEESKADFATRVAKLILAQEGFQPANVVFETTGVPACNDMSIACSLPGGKVVCIGMGQPIQTLNIGLASHKEIDLIGIWRYANTYPTGIRMVSSGQIDLKPFITHKFPLEQTKEAFELTMKGPKGLMKCMISSK
ncbi:hypothetical protein B7463_g1437, partial [Scytalidium lignicola]